MIFRTLIIQHHTNFNVFPNLLKRILMTTASYFLINKLIIRFLMLNYSFNIEKKILLIFQGLFMFGIKLISGSWAFINQNLNAILKYFYFQLNLNLLSYYQFLLMLFISLFLNFLWILKIPFNNLIKLNLKCLHKFFIQKLNFAHFMLILDLLINQIIFCLHLTFHIRFKLFSNSKLHQRF